MRFVVVGDEFKQHMRFVDNDSIEASSLHSVSYAAVGSHNSTFVVESKHAVLCSTGVQLSSGSTLSVLK